MRITPKRSPIAVAPGVTEVDGNNTAETLWDTEFSTDLNAGGGNDVVVAYQSANDVANFAPDTMDGGAGFDTLSYALLADAVVVDLAADLGQRIGNLGLPGAPDDLFNIEAVIGTGFNDTLRGDEDGNFLAGGWGNDLIEGRAGHDTLGGDGGADTVLGGYGNDAISGWTGSDSLRGGYGADTIAGEADADGLFGDQGDDSLLGGTGDDVLDGGRNRDTMDGGDDDDTMLGGSGADDMTGGEGNDSLLGGTGNDTLDGGEGDDRLAGEAGNDLIEGGAGIDTVIYDVVGELMINLAGVTNGDLGFDTLSGIENVTTYGSVDSLYGTAAANVLDAGGNDDFLYGFDGDDTLDGGSGNDEMYGGEDDDVMTGEIGDDLMEGQDGADTIEGNGGEDTLAGGYGSDDLTGGSDGDIFHWNNGDLGSDNVLDFDVDADWLSFDYGFFAVEPVDGDIDPQVLVLASVDGDARLIANVDGFGWSEIAEFEDVTVAELQALIDDGHVLYGDYTGGIPGQIPDDFEMFA